MYIIYFSKKMTSINFKQYDSSLSNYEVFIINFIFVHLLCLSLLLYMFLKYYVIFHK